ELHRLDALLAALHELHVAGLQRKLHACGLEIATRVAAEARKVGLADLPGLLAQIGDLHAAHHPGMAPDAVASLVERLPNGRGQAALVCADPYPCALWRGWIEGLGVAFRIPLRLEHGSVLCKEQGADRCEYVLAW